MVAVVGEPARVPSPGAEFEALYREHFAFVWRMLLHFGVPLAQVEDAAQDVFIVIHRRLPDWDPSVPARSWLYGVARRVAADHRRADARHRRKLAALAASDRGASPDAVERRLAGRERLTTLEQILAKLDPRLSEVFVLADVEGMTARELGELLQLSPNTVSGRLRRARAAVDRALARRESRRPS
jgi:RNA polymerase sigma-70 factor (ECF subfamily)